MGLQIFLETGQNVMEEMSNVRYDDFEVGQGAELGETDTGKLVFDDPGGLYDVVGWRHWRAIETTASPTLIASGRIMAKTITRGDDVRASLRTGTDRQWDCDACDENILLGIRVIHGTAANRPAETAGERLRWLLSTSFTTLIDNGHVTYPTDRLDAHDYTGENDKDLIASCAEPGGYNYFAVKDTASSTTELFFMLSTSSSWQSSLRISNDLTDIDDVTTFEAAYTTSVRRTPERIAESVFLPYAGGSGSAYVYVSDSTIGDQYAYVDKTAPMAEVHTSTAATVVANRLLAASNEEDDRISTSIAVPASQVNDLRLWHRVQLKLTHVTGYEAFRWCRVLHRAVKPEGAGYRITMELTPVEAAPDCIVLGRASTDTGSQWTLACTNTATGFYPPSSSYGNSGDYVGGDTIGRVFYMSDGGGGIRSRPWGAGNGYGSWGGWTAGYYHISKSGMPLGWADGGGGPNVGNPKLEIITIGPGTLTVYTSQTVGSTWKLYAVDTSTVVPRSFVVEATQIDSGTTGDPSTTIVVPNDGYCEHIWVCTDNSSYLNPALGLFYGGHDWVAAT